MEVFFFSFSKVLQPFKTFFKSMNEDLEQKPPSHQWADFGIVTWAASSEFGTYRLC